MPTANPKPCQLENFVSFSNEIAATAQKSSDSNDLEVELNDWSRPDISMKAGASLRLSNQTINVISLRRCSSSTDWPIVVGVQSYPVAAVSVVSSTEIVVQTAYFTRALCTGSPRATKWRKKCHRIAGWPLRGHLKQSTSRKKWETQ